MWCLYVCFLFVTLQAAALFVRWVHSTLERALRCGLWIDFYAIFIVFFSEWIALSEALQSSYFRR